MASVGVPPMRNPSHRMNFLFASLFLLLICDAPIHVGGCKSNEECLTIQECRKLQKQNNIQTSRVTDLSFVYPCDETSRVMTICCTVRKPSQQLFEEHPGYNITYGDLESSQSENIPSLAVPPPLNVGPNEDQSETKKRETEDQPGEQKIGTCGLFQGGGADGDAARGQFPWLALLGKCDHATGEFSVDCGGSLISDRYVLTSANCLDNLKGAPELVRLGDYDRSSDDFQSTGLPQNYGIEKIIVHEQFNYPVLKNDIALVRLNSTCTSKFSDGVRPICLPEAPSPESTEYIMAGWRTHGSREVPPTSIPKFGPLSSENSGLCDIPIPLQPLSETQMCFGSNPSSCYGDFGGPLIEIIKTGATEIAVQAAIFSRGGSQCNAKFSGDLYTKVFPFRDWIMKNMEE